jgi:hypothetical protein
MSRNQICHTKGHKISATKNLILSKISLSYLLPTITLSLSFLSPAALYLSLSPSTPAAPISVMCLSLYIFLFTLSPFINASLSFSPLPGLVSPLRPWFLCTWREAHLPPLTFPSWPLARVMSVVPSAPRPDKPLDRYLSLFTGSLDLCTRLSPRPPSIKVGQHPLSLSLWLSCVEIRPIKLIRTKTIVSACKRLQRGRRVVVVPFCGGLCSYCAFLTC